MRCVRGAGAAAAAPLRCPRHVARRAVPRSAVRRAGSRALVAPRAARAAFSASADSGGVPAQPQLAAEALNAALDADVTNSPDGGWPAASAPAGPMMPRLFSRAEPVTLETLQQCFPLVRMDKFQKRALQAVLADKSVVVSAPTGSGKTLVAEAAVVAALAAGKRAYYTTPLKALSNQKLREFRERFGTDVVGLKTGDAAINPDAQLVVMTTEILRNMLYSSAGGKAGDASLVNVGLVVLDEVHYMSDAERGTVWEECVIYCPKDVQLVCLSATVGNPDDLQAWIAAVHGPCELVTSSWRPIPLSFFFVKRGGDERGVPQGLVPLLNRRGDRINRLLEGRAEDGQESSARQGSRMVSSWRKDAPSQDFVLRHLVQQELLPAIWFIFSRARCDEAVVAAAAAASPNATVLVKPEERERLAAALDALRKSCPEAVRQEYTAPLLEGVAAHHAGCLPAWKTMVEELFQEGLIKVVFATETLAAGINMPARAVVLSTTSKRDNDGPRSLTVNEFMQMAGRAGRRGYDTQGTVVLVQSPFEGALSGAELALGEPEALVSRFAVSYGMVLNLLRGRSLEQVQSVVTASFGNFLRSLARSARSDRYGDMKAELESLRSNMSPKVLEAERALNTMTKLRGTLQEERRALRILQTQLISPSSSHAGDSDDPEGDGFRWLLDRPTPVPVLIRVAAGGASRADSKRSQVQPPGWGQLRVDGEANDADDDELEEDELTFGSFSASGGGRFGDDVGMVNEVVLSAAIVLFEPVAATEDGAVLGGWEFVALGADNVWYRGPLDVVVGLGDEWLLSSSHVPPPPLLVTHSAWRWRSGTGRVAGDRSTFPAAGRISTALVGVSEGDGMPVAADSEGAKFVQAAKDRIAELESQLTALMYDVAVQKNIKKAATRLTRIRTLEASLSKLGRRLAETTAVGWGEFQSAFSVLRARGALEGDTEPKLTRLGEAAASVRAENELWLAVALLSGALDGLSPLSLAGVVASLLSEECISRPNVYAAYRPSPDAAAAMQQLMPLAVQLEEIQQARSFTAPICLSPLFVGLVESWAAGSDWKQVCADTSLDEGDVARLLRRVGEFLGQMSDVPHTASSLRSAAKAARRLVDRPPISDLVA